jgi:folate-binding Fe-S cluster repair protein YgfZ
MHQVTRSVASEIVVYFNFGFSGVNLDSNSISQFALTDLISHIRNSVTTSAFNQEVYSENLTISKLEIDEIVFVTQHEKDNNVTKTLQKFNFKIKFKVFHTSSSVTSSAFEEIDKITKKMFEKITKKTIEPEFETSPCFVKPDFHATCTRQHVYGVVSII